MKKSILLFVLVGMLALVGCSSSETPPIETSEISKPESTFSSEVAEELVGLSDVAEDEELTIQENLYVADAAMYRGTIGSIVEDGETTTVVLTQPEGINFGTPTITFSLDDDTKFSFDESELVEGSFIEVFYGRSMGETDYTQTFNAIAVNRYIDATSANFNGEIIEIAKDVENDTQGSFTLKELGTEQVIVFYYGDESSLYLNVDELVVGDKLNIFHSGAVALSLPAQGNIIEARTYYDAAAETEIPTATPTANEQPITGAIA